MKIQIKFPIVVASIITTTACVAEQESEHTYIPEASCVGGNYGLMLPKYYPDLIRIGKITKTLIHETENWGTYTTTLKTIHFDGLELGIATFSNDRHRYMLSHAVVSSPRWASVSPFKVGEPTHSTAKRLKHHTVNDPELKKEYGSEGVTLKFKSHLGRIREVTYLCYTG